jgi:hypothetical protein
MDDPGYNGLVDFGYKKHFRVHHSKNEFVRGSFHINGIELFWGWCVLRKTRKCSWGAKTKLVKLKDLKKICLIYS